MSMKQVQIVDASEAQLATFVTLFLGMPIEDEDRNDRSKLVSLIETSWTREHIMVADDQIASGPPTRVEGEVTADNVKEIFGDEVQVMKGPSLFTDPICVVNVQQGADRGHVRFRSRRAAGRDRRGGAGSMRSRYY